MQQNKILIGTSMSHNILNDGQDNINTQNESKISFSNLKSKLQYSNGDLNWSGLVYECRNSRKLVLLVVFIALFFDNMLMTTVGNKSIIFLWINTKKF